MTRPQHLDLSSVVEAHSPRVSSTVPPDRETADFSRHPGTGPDGARRAVTVQRQRERLRPQARGVGGAERVPRLVAPFAATTPTLAAEVEVDRIPELRGEIG